MPPALVRRTRARRANVHRTGSLPGGSHRRAAPNPPSPQVYVEEARSCVTSAEREIAGRPSAFFIMPGPDMASESLASLCASSVFSAFAADTHDTGHPTAHTRTRGWRTHRRTATTQLKARARDSSGSSLGRQQPLYSTLCDARISRSLPNMACVTTPIRATSGIV